MYPFRNLAFQGGGSKALAYHGAIRVLEEEGILAPIERVAGTSAGAMLATLLSMRLDVDEIIRVYGAFDLEGFSAAPVNLLGRLQGNISAVSRLATRYGWYSLDFLYEWLQQSLAPYCRGNGRATFGQFRRWGFRDLYVVVTNVTQRHAEVFCADLTPDVAVADALIISQSLPLYFEGLQFDGQRFGSGDYYADGGMTLNYPLPVFDERLFARNNRWFVNGVNWESLGCRLYRPRDCAPQREPISNLLAYAQSTFETLVEAQAVAYRMSQSTQRRTININDCCVETTDFSIHARPEDATYQRLVRSGADATRAFLDAYNPPLIKPLLPFTLYFDRARRALKKRIAARRRGGMRS